MERNQRRHRRYDAEGVQGSLVYSLDARVLNMSLTGMAIETATFLKTGGQYWLRVPSGDTQLRFKAEVKWCHLVRNERTAAGESRAVFKAGIDFREILDDSARQVLDFLQQHVVVELGRRLTGRFHLAAPERAALSVRHEFDVRRLSLGGMLVETVWDPPVDTEVEVELQVPNVVRTAARVRSVIPVPAAGPYDPPTFAVGLAFHPLAEEAQAALSRFVQGLLE